MNNRLNNFKCVKGLEVNTDKNDFDIYQQQKLTLNVLGILNKETDENSIIQKVVVAIQQETGIEAVGVRLKDGNDYPYFSTKGFTDRFLKSEMSLYPNKKNRLDIDKNKDLNCFCGVVINEKTNPDFPIFTRSGSFWTNSTTELIATIKKNDWKINVRNTCYNEGYESVALIPLKSNNNIIGLLQLIDHRINMFSEEDVYYFENLGNSIGIALTKINSKKSLLETNTLLNEAESIAIVGSWSWNLRTEVITWSDNLCKIHEISPDEFDGKFETALSFIYPEDLKEVNNKIKQLLDRKKVNSFDYRIRTKTGDIKYLRGNQKLSFDSYGEVVLITGILKDITIEKLREKELKEFEKKSSLWLENSTICTKVLDLDFNLQYMSPAGIDALQIDDITQFYNKPYPLHFYPKSFKEQMNKCLKQSKSTGKITKLEASIIDIKGNELWYQSTIVPIKDDNGCLESFLVLSTETTEQKHAYDKILKSEIKFKQIFENNIAIKLIIDPVSGEIVDANTAACEFYQYSYNELTSLKIWDINLLSKSEIKNKMSQASSNNQKFFEFKHKLADGSIRDVEVFSGKIEIEGKQFFYSIINDVSKRKKIERIFEKQQYYLTKAQEIGIIGTWEFDLITNKLIWTDENYRIYGIPIGTELTYEIFSNQIHPDDKEFVDREWMASLDGKQFDIEFRLLVDSEIKWVREKAETIYDNDGKVVSLIGFTQDITIQKKVLSDLKNNERDLKNSNIALREVLKSIEKEKDEQMISIQAHINRIILPLVRKLEIGANDMQSNYISLLTKNLETVMAPFVGKLDSLFVKLSPREVEVCNMLKDGMNSKEIAETLNTSVGTVFNQRKSIRKKLDIKDENISLVTYLKSI